MKNVFLVLDGRDIGLRFFSRGFLSFCTVQYSRKAAANIIAPACNAISAVLGYFTNPSCAVGSSLSDRSVFHQRFENSILAKHFMAPWGQGARS